MLHKFTTPVPRSNQRNQQPDSLLAKAIFLILPELYDTHPAFFLVFPFQRAGIIKNDCFETKVICEWQKGREAPAAGVTSHTNKTHTNLKDRFTTVPLHHRLWLTHLDDDSPHGSFPASDQPSSLGTLCFVRCALFLVVCCGVRWWLCPFILQKEKLHLFEGAIRHVKPFFGQVVTVCDGQADRQIESTTFLRCFSFEPVKEG
jgi:hypothetical protein